MDSEELVKDFFERIEFTIEKISESDEETPDFLAQYCNEEYIVELKTKLPSEAQINERNEKLRSGEVHDLVEVILPNSRLHGIVKKAKEQIETYGHPNAFNLIWFLNKGHLSEARREQFKSTLFGSTTVVDWGGSATGRDCYYFYNSEFYRYREVLDAAVVSDESELQLCVNTLSPNYKKFIQSHLHTVLIHGVVDPIELEKNGHAFLV